MHYLIDTQLRQKYNDAGSKARDDISSILSESMKVERFMVGSSKPEKAINYFRLAHTVKRNADAAVFQYPFYINGILQSLIKKWKPENSILLIHDIRSLRTMSDSKEIEREISLINTFRFAISHNSRMTDWLVQNGCHSQIVNLEIFDYLTSGEPEKEERVNAVAFAGNLSPEKSRFLYDMPDLGYEIHAYGSNFDDVMGQNMNYMGSFSPDILPGKMNEKYGLIWDGSSLDACSGTFGNYLKYNNPHKTSLYLAAGMPVIVWNQAAIADFVIEHNIGITISSLADLNDTICGISEEEYEEMSKNVRVISGKLQNGFYTKQAIEKCLNLIMGVK